MPLTDGIQSPMTGFFLGQGAVEGGFGILLQRRYAEDHESGVAKITSARASGCSATMARLDLRFSYFDVLGTHVTLPCPVICNRCVRSRCKACHFVPLHLVDRIDYFPPMEISLGKGSGVIMAFGL